MKESFFYSWIYHLLSAAANKDMHQRCRMMTRGTYSCLFLMGVEEFEKKRSWWSGLVSNSSSFSF